MQASIVYPIYNLKIVTKNGKTYSLKKVTTDLNLSEYEKDLAQKVSISLANIKTADGYLTGLLGVRDRVYVTADTGSGYKEVFRGFLWDKNYESAVAKTLSIVSYDNLIYLQNSKDSFYFSSGKNTKDIISSICNKWGIKLVFNYESITHSKKILRCQYISDSIIEILDEVKKKTGKRYTIYSENDVMHIETMGQNTTVYGIKKKKNISRVKTTETLDGMVTKVVITGKKDKNDREPILATVTGNISEYGTLQDMISKDEDTTLEKAKSEAKQILNEKGKPERTYSLEDVVDNPLVRKGHKVSVDAGNLKGDFLVLSVEHDAMNRAMSLEVARV